MTKINKLLKEQLISKSIPEWAVQQIVSDATDRLKAKMITYINTYSESPQQKKQGLQIAKATLDEIEEEMFNLILQKLTEFNQQLLFGLILNENDPRIIK